MNDHRHLSLHHVLLKPQKVQSAHIGQHKPLLSDDISWVLL